MLGSNPRYLTVPEMQFKLPLLAARRGEMAKLLGELEADWRFKLWNVRSETMPTETSPRGVLEEIVRRYGIKVRKPQPTVWIDHTPLNVRHAQTLSVTFPDAAIVHIV